MTYTISRGPRLLPHLERLNALAHQIHFETRYDGCGPFTLDMLAERYPVDFEFVPSISRPAYTVVGSTCGHVVIDSRLPQRWQRFYGARGACRLMLHHAVWKGYAPVPEPPQAAQVDLQTALFAATLLCPIWAVSQILEAAHTKSAESAPMAANVPEATELVAGKLEIPSRLAIQRVRVYLDWSSATHESMSFDL